MLTPKQNDALTQGLVEIMTVIERIKYRSIPDSTLALITASETLLGVFEGRTPFVKITRQLLNCLTESAFEEVIDESDAVEEGKYF